MQRRKDISTEHLFNFLLQTQFMLREQDLTLLEGGGCAFRRYQIPIQAGKITWYRPLLKCLVVIFFHTKQKLHVCKGEEKNQYFFLKFYQNVLFKTAGSDYYYFCLFQVKILFSMQFGDRNSLVQISWSTAHKLLVTFYGKYYTAT